MKYIKLFEAFESIKLGKTLAYIPNKEEKDKFMVSLNGVTKSVDFPISELSDDLFEYLPFKRALELTTDPCTAKSSDSYPDHSVPGSICQGGQVDRMWGRGIRKANCLLCNGTGKSNKAEIKFVKFWFDKNGRYICTTATDGISRKIAEVTLDDPDWEKSWDIGRQITREELEQALSNETDLPTGLPVRVRAGVGIANGYIYRRSSETVSGLTPIWFITNSPDFEVRGRSGEMFWKKFGRHPWVLMDANPGVGFRSVRKLNKKNKPATEMDAFAMNPVLEPERFQIIEYENQFEKLKDAHFALVLDYGKLRSLKFKPVSQTKIERKEAKKGATALLSSEEIKKQNIQRYLDEITNRTNVPTEIKDFTSTMVKFLGGKYLGFFILANSINPFRIFIKQISELMFKAQESEDETELGKLYKEANQILKAKIIENKNIMDDIVENISNIRKSFSPDTQESEILELMIKLNSVMYDVIKGFKFETIEDLEVAYRKIESIKSSFYNDSFSTYYVRYGVDLFQSVLKGLFVAKMNPSNYFDLTDKHNFLKMLPKFTNLVKRI